MSDDKQNDLPVITAVGNIRMPLGSLVRPVPPPGKEVADDNPTVDGAQKREG